MGEAKVEIPWARFRPAQVAIDELRFRQTNPIARKRPRPLLNGSKGVQKVSIAWEKLKPQGQERDRLHGLEPALKVVRSRQVPAFLEPRAIGGVGYGLAVASRRLQVERGSARELELVRGLSRRRHHAFGMEQGGGLPLDAAALAREEGHARAVELLARQRRDRHRRGNEVSAAIGLD